MRPWPRKEQRKRGKCDYCKQRRIIGKRTQFCRECLERWDQVVEEHFDGDPFYPLKAAAAIMRSSKRHAE